MEDLIFPLIFLYFNCVYLTISFNIDTEYPIIFKDEFDPLSHFGYTVLLSNSNEGGGWVFIGAPKGNSSHPQKSNISEPGVIWRCKLGTHHSSQGGNICQMMEMDPTGNVNPRLGKLHLMPHEHYKEGNWLSSPMLLGDSNRFITCASRWANQLFTSKGSESEKELFMNGICYWTGKEIINEENTNSTWPWLPEGYQLSPLLNQYQQVLGKVNYWAMGQAGFSAFITGDNHLILGAPGVSEWKGTVIEYRDSNRTKPNKATWLDTNNEPNYRYNAEGSEFAEYSVGSVLSELENSSYFGYAVTSGHFFNLNSTKKQYAGGAPRTKSYFGQVFIFTFEDSSTAISNLHQITHPLEIPLINSTNSNGEETSYKIKGFGSYFGSVLLGVDVNGDGWDDLLVGAPLLSFEKKNLKEKGGGNAGESTQCESFGDEGGVFVYFSNGVDFDRKDVQSLFGNEMRGARFGSAISSGDINSDALNDIVVGAPYENNGRGAIYIYFGSKGKKLEFQQRISPEEINSGIRGFGISLSLGVDIDENLTNDLAVGAYGTNQAFVFRTIPIVKLNGNLSTSTSKLYSNISEFDVIACVNYTSKKEIPNLGIWIKLDFGKINRDVKMVEFISQGRLSNGNFTPDWVQGKLEVDKKGRCETFRVNKTKEIEDDRIPSVAINMEIWLEREKKGPIKPIIYKIKKSLNNLVPNVSSEGSRSEFKDFYKKTPFMHQNQSESISYNLSIASLCEDDRIPTCLANLSVTADFYDNQRHIAKNQTFIIGSTERIILRIWVANSIEKAETPIWVDISWKSGFGYPIPGGKSNCSLRISGHFCKLPILSPIYKKRKDFVDLELNMGGLNGGLKNNLQFNYIASTNSLQVTGSKSSGRASLPLETLVDILFEGNEGNSPIINSYYQNSQIEHIDLNQYFKVKIDGKSPIFGIKVEFNIPISERDEESFLSIGEPMQNNFQCYKPKHFDYTKGGEDEDSYTDMNLNEIIARKFQLPDSRFLSSTIDIRSVANFTIEPDKYIISCHDPQTKCIKIVCLSHKLIPAKTDTSKIIFTMKMRSKFAGKIFDEGGVNAITLQTDGLISIFNQKGEIFRESRTIYRNTIELHKLPEVKLWIWIAAIGGGILLLAMIIATLRQVGFFKRSKKEELEALMLKYKDSDKASAAEVLSRYESTSRRVLTK